MITGHTEKHRVEAARDAGVTEFLAKPITAHSLFSRIAEIVERPRAFVRCDSYFGPDRRRHQSDSYAGPWRRHDDFKTWRCARWSCPPNRRKSSRPTPIRRWWASRSGPRAAALRAPPTAVKAQTGMMADGAAPMRDAVVPYVGELEEAGADLEPMFDTRRMKFAASPKPPALSHRAASPTACAAIWTMPTSIGVPPDPPWWRCMSAPSAAPPATEDEMQPDERRGGAGTGGAGRPRQLADEPQGAQSTLNV